jgi:hypothetical protein
MDRYLSLDILYRISPSYTGHFYLGRRFKKALQTPQISVLIINMGGRHVYKQSLVQRKQNGYILALKNKIPLKAIMNQLEVSKATPRRFWPLPKQSRCPVPGDNIQFSWRAWWSRCLQGCWRTSTEKSGPSSVKI